MNLKMLTLIPLLLFGLSLQLFADGVGNISGGPKQSWQDIMTNPQIKPAFPPIVMGDQMIGYNILCIHNDIVRTKYKIKVVDKVTDTISFQYLYEEYGAVPNSGHCHTSTIPRQLPIYVYNTENQNNGIEQAKEVLFVKNYTLPYCKEE